MGAVSARQSDFAAPLSAVWRERWPGPLEGLPGRRKRRRVGAAFSQLCRWHYRPSY